MFDIFDFLKRKGKYFFGIFEVFWGLFRDLRFEI
jgi:hypothetical protein